MWIENNNVALKKFLLSRTFLLLVLGGIIGAIGFAIGFQAARSGISRKIIEIEEPTPTPASDQPLWLMLDAMATDEARVKPAVETPTPAPNAPLAESIELRGAALRLSGAGENGAGGVVLPLDALSRSLNSKDDFTIEFWLKTYFGLNGTQVCAGRGSDWEKINLILSQRMPGTGGDGTLRIGLANGRIAFGMDVSDGGGTLCGTVNLADGVWHHVAVTHAAENGALLLFVDGAPDGQAACAAGMPDNAGASVEENLPVPYLALGGSKINAEKQAFYTGWIDEIRVSNALVYDEPFLRPNMPFLSDATTVLLFHLDEGRGALLSDSRAAEGAGGSGWCAAGGGAAPEWWSDTPFDPPGSARGLGLCVWDNLNYLPVINR